VSQMTGPSGGFEAQDGRDAESRMWSWALPLLALLAAAMMFLTLVGSPFDRGDVPDGVKPAGIGTATTGASGGSAATGNISGGPGAAKP
jgi:hypothetical protein